MNSLSLILITLLLPINLLANPLAAPFQVHDKFTLAPIDGPIIFQTESHSITRSPLTNFASYDYYYVQLTQDSSLRNQIADIAKVVTHQKQEFMILEMTNENQIQAVAKLLHDSSGACGMIQKLSEEPMSLTTISVQPRSSAKISAVESTISSVNIQNIIDTISLMESWKTRHHADTSGVNTGERLKELYEALTPEDRTDVTIELVNHTGSKQKSIRIRIEGRSEPNKIIVLGSHIDSINSRGSNSDAPGADDNASGTATNMEVFRVLMENNIRPEATIEIHGYAAEEIGLVGSKEIAEDYRSQNKNVIAMVQFDMNGYAHRDPQITFVSNGTDRGLSSDLSKLARQYLDVKVTSNFLMFGSSDHASWDRIGVPVAFPTEDTFNFNRKIHTHEDTLSNINSPEQIEAFGKLGVIYFMHYAGY